MRGGGSLGELLELGGPRLGGLRSEPLRLDKLLLRLLRLLLAECLGELEIVLDWPGGEGLERLLGLGNSLELLRLLSLGSSPELLRLLPQNRDLLRLHSLSLRQPLSVSLLLRVKDELLLLLRLHPLLLRLYSLLLGL